MAIAILVGRDDAARQQLDWFIKGWQQALYKLQPQLDIRVWPAIGNAADIEFALVWQHPLGALNQFPNLRGIGSLGAGVDHVFADVDLPANIPMVRVVDPYMANDIVQYVTACVLEYVKRMNHWRELQWQRKWLKQPPFNFSEKTVGVMGLGFLGGKAVNILLDLGLRVVGWSNSPKEISGMQQFYGAAQLESFLQETDILVCMLPLTQQTKNILNAKHFAQLRNGAYIINVGRGEHLVEEDLLAALASGKISGAALDVFRQEPLPSEHPFWINPRICVTPHIASVTNPDTVAPQMLENYQRAIHGKELLNQVDFHRGY